LKEAGEEDWRKIPLSGESVATNHSMEGVEEGDWQEVTGVKAISERPDALDPIRSFGPSERESTTELLVERSDGRTPAGGSRRNRTPTGLQGTGGQESE